MGALPKPTVPAGPMRALVDALHETHHRSGWPSLREMAKQVGCSHTTISVAFSEPRVPRWGLLELIVEALGGDTARFHELWLAASLAERGHDPAEPQVAIGSGTTGHPPPRQLPADVLGFTGRAAELDELDRLLRTAWTTSAVVIAAVSGTAGVGKTALAVRWAHRVASRFVDGQLYLNLHGYGPDKAVEPAEALAGFLRAFGQDDRAIPRLTSERSARYRTLLAGRRVLVVLDNARSVEHVRDLLPGTAPCFVVVTSRDTLPGLVARYGALRVSLGRLPPVHSVTLLRRLIGVRVEDEPESAAELARRCARLPLALRIAAELAVSRPRLRLGELVDELGDDRRPLSLLDAGSDDDMALRAMFLSSYRQLGTDAARAFTLLGLLPGRDIDVYATAALLGEDEPTAHRALDALIRAHLIEEVRPGRFAMHDLLRVYATEQAQQVSAAERSAAVDRLLDHYLLTAQTTDRDWMDSERHNLLAAVTTADATGHRPTQIGAFAGVLAPYLDSGGHYQDALTLQQIALRTARTHGDVNEEAAALTRLATVHRRLADYPRALKRYREALHLHRIAGNRHGQAESLRGLGIVEWRRGRYPEALVALTEALRAHRELDDRAGEGATLYSLGLVHRRLGRYADATTYYEAALAALREIGDRAGLASALGNLGVVHMRLGRYRDALDHHQAALAIHRELGNRVDEGIALTNIGSTTNRTGQHDEALAYHEQALAIYHAAGYRIGEADATHGIGVAHADVGRGEVATLHLRRAVSMARELSEAGLEMQALNDLGHALRQRGHTQEAEECHHSALDLAEQTGDRYERARALDAIAHLRAACGARREADGLWREALREYEELGVPEAEALQQNMVEEVG